MKAIISIIGEIFTEIGKAAVDIVSTSRVGGAKEVYTPFEFREKQSHEAPKMLDSGMVYARATSLTTVQISIVGGQNQ